MEANNTSLDSLWTDILKSIEKTVSKGNFITVFKTTRLESLENNTATISCPSIMIKQMLEKRYAENVKKELEQKTGQEIKLSFIIKPQVFKEKAAPGPLFQEEKKVESLKIGHLPRVRKDYTFINFAVSGSNQLAFAAATTVAKNLGSSYNPLFIYGPVGVGKTHLMHAIANDVYRGAPEKKIIYITSEEFTNEVVDAIRTNDTARMKRRFRSAALLLIDDIQFIEGKERVQEELFHTFNILIDGGSQIVLSSDRPPQEIKRLEKRLSSRFAGGLTVDIEAPDFELKTAIVQKKAEKFGFDLPTDLAMALAEKAEDTRSLEGMLLQVITLSNTGFSTTEDLIKKIAGGEERKEARLHFEDILKAVCSFYEVKPTLLKGPKRDARLVRARQVAMYLLKNELGLTLVEIGNLLGGRDHTTVIHGIEKIEKQIFEKTNTREDILGITKSLKRNNL